MNMHAGSNTAQATPDIADPAPQPTPDFIEPPPEKTETIIDADLSAADTARSEAPTLVLPVNALDAASEPSHAAKGNSESASPPPPRKSAAGDIKADIKAKWKQHVGAAKLVWSKLSNEELLKTQGNEHKLASLVQERHDIARSDAYRQVNSFFANQKA